MCHCPSEDSIYYYNQIRSTSLSTHGNFFFPNRYMVLPRAHTPNENRKQLFWLVTNSMGSKTGIIEHAQKSWETAVIVATAAGETEVYVFRTACSIENEYINESNEIRHTIHSTPRAHCTHICSLISSWPLKSPLEWHHGRFERNFDKCKLNF